MSSHRPASLFGPSLLAALALALGCDNAVTPAPPPPPIDSPEKVVLALARAYQVRDPDLFASLLAHVPEANAEYVFLLSTPPWSGETQWDYAEEIRIHQRMLRPEGAVPPVPSELWMTSVTMTMTPQEAFSEVTAYYSRDGGEDGGLDSLRWKALNARYSSGGFLDLAGTDYKVECDAHFVVIEDRTKQSGDTGQFLLYIWQDIERPLSTAPAVSARAATLERSATWTSVKGLFR